MCVIHDVACKSSWYKKYQASLTKKNIAMVLRNVYVKNECVK